MANEGITIDRIKRYAVYKIQKIFGFRLVKTEKVGLIFEEIHLKKFFKHYKVDCVFDVGANEGQYATMLRKRVGYKGPIISFEPIPKAAEILRENSKSDAQWYVEQCALDKSAGKVMFNVMREDQFSSLHAPSESEVDLFKEKNKVTEQISVETATLKDVFGKYKTALHFKRPFLKMDTQGHDLQIAQGGEEVLRLFIGLQSELSIKRIYEGVNDYKKVIEYYNAQGFELSALVPNNEGHFPHLVEIDCIMFNKNPSA